MRIFMKKQEEKGKRSAKKILISIGSIFILVLAALSFVFIPAMVQSGGDELPPFGYYYGKPIKYTQGSYFAAMVNYYYESLGNVDQINIEDEYRIFNNAFNDTVMNMAYTRAVDKTGYIVPDSAIERDLKTYFMQDGVFSQKAFNSVSDNQKLDMWNAIEEALFASRYTDDVFGSQTDVMGDYSMYGLKSSSKETDFIKEMGQNQRAFEYVTFETSKYPQEQAIAWAENNSELFTKYNLDVISVNDESTAKNLLNQIQGGQILFEDAVSEYSSNYYSGSDGVLTSSYNYQIKDIVKDEASLNAIISLQADTVSDVIETTSGYSIFKAKAEPTVANFEDPDTITVVTEYMLNYESGVVEAYFMVLASDFTNNASLSSFEAASKTAGLEIKNIELAPLNYGNNPIIPTMNITGSYLPNLDTNESFLKEAFSLQIGQISKPIPLSGMVCVFKLTEEEVVDVNTMMYMYYTNYFDKLSAASAVMTSDKLENNVMQVFLENTNY